MQIIALDLRWICFLFFYQGDASEKKLFLRKIKNDAKNTYHR